MDGHKFTNAKAVRDFTLAGHATLTLSSLVSGQHYSYNVEKADNADRWFVKVLLGGETWTYIGSIKNLQFDLTKKSKLPLTTPCVTAFGWFVYHVIKNGRIPPSLVIRHEGRCGRCNRPLTHPDSIDLGIGPECGRIMHELKAEAV